MRKIIRDLIIAETSLTDVIPADQWVSSGSLNDDNAPPRPFAVLRYGTTSPGMADVTRSILTIWIHDELGSYNRIDQVMALLDDTLSGREHVSDEEGNELIRCEWEGNSGDLYDPGFRTITRNKTFNLIGKGV